MSKLMMPVAIRDQTDVVGWLLNQLLMVFMSSLHHLYRTMTRLHLMLAASFCAAYIYSTDILDK